MIYLIAVKFAEGYLFNRGMQDFGAETAIPY